jgi:hypothetical protein
MVFLISFLDADTDGLTTAKIWTSVPTEIYNETAPLNSEDNSQSFNDTINVDEQIIVDNTTGWIEDVAESVIVENNNIQSSPVEKEVIASNDINDDYIFVSESTTVEDIQPTLALNTVKDVQPTLVSHDDFTVEDNEPSGRAHIVENSFNINSYVEKGLAFGGVLVKFIQKNTLLASLFLLTFSFISYLLFREPSYRDNDLIDYDDEIDVHIPQAKLPKQKVSDDIIYNKSSIITQSQYSTLYGLINETFIYEKERVLLSNDITQDRKNREMISLEWKFNQILHFSLPKLSSNNSSHFTEGVYELLEEDLTKDILVVALRDILKSTHINSNDKVRIEKKMKSLIPKKVYA